MSESMIYIGIDIAKTKFDVALPVGQAYKNHCFDNTRQGFRRLLSWIKKQGISSYHICMEATGRYSLELANFLYHLGIPVSVINPKQIKHFAHAKLMRNKTDQADATVIAHYGRVMPHRPYQPMDETQRRIKLYTQTRDTLIAQQQQFKNQLEALDIKDVATHIRKIIRHLQKEIKEVETKIQALIDGDPLLTQQCTLLCSIPGISTKTCYTLIGNLLDIHLFHSPKQLTAYIGISPEIKQSGKFKGKTKLSKTGNIHLRRALYMPAVVAKNQCQCYQAIVNRMKSKGMAEKAIVGVMMRKLTHIIFAVLKNQTPFQPDLKQFQA